MRKGVFGRQFDRTKNQRAALFKGLIVSLVQNGELTTTLAKAKAIKADAEKLITKAKKNMVADRRTIFKVLNKKNLVDKLCCEIAPVFKERNGGYLRIVRLGMRKGDGAQMAKIMFTEEVIKIQPKEIEAVKTPAQAETKSKTKVKASTKKKTEAVK